MPQTKYMELDSNYRNRTNDKKQACFDVGISQYGMRTNINALDPITNAYPEIVFRPDDFAKTTPKYITPTEGNLSGSSTATTFIVTGDSTTVLVSSYYVGAVIAGTSRIVEWTVLDPTINAPTTYGTIKVVVDSPISGLSSSTSLDIYNPTTDPTTLPYIFIPTSKSIDNYYNKYVLWNETLNVSVPITAYDGVTHLATMGGDISAFKTSDTYVIRRENPTGTGTLSQTKYYNPPVSVPNWFEISQPVNQGYINGFVRIYKTTGTPPINSTTKVVDPASNIVAKIVGVKEFEYHPCPKDTTTPVVLVPINTIIVDSVPSDVNANPTQYSYEIMPFTIDNYSPFVYNGSISSQNQPVAQEISLNSLILPNVPLKNGGRIAFYPYVYVELENTSATTKSNNNIIYSNNPHTYKAVFKVPITDLNHPGISPFVKLTGNNMTQTMTFKQNDNMKVAVKLPSGDLFETIKDDNPPGQAPDPFIQISFCFGMQRV